MLGILLAMHYVELSLKRLKIHFAQYVPIHQIQWLRITQVCKYFSLNKRDHIEKRRMVPIAKAQQIIKLEIQNRGKWMRKQVRGFEDYVCLPQPIHPES